MKDGEDRYPHPGTRSIVGDKFRFLETKGGTNAPQEDPREEAPEKRRGGAAGLRKMQLLRCF